MLKDISNLPNFLTALRFAFIPFIANAYLNGDIATAFVYFSICVVTDFLDGYIARATHQQSKFGAIFDTLSDKLLVNVLFFTLTIPKDFISNTASTFIFVAVLVRDLGLIFLAIAYWDKIVDDIKADFLGKVCVFFEYFYIILVMLYNMNKLILNEKFILESVIFILLPVSFFRYFFKFKTKFAENEQP